MSEPEFARVKSTGESVRVLDWSCGTVARLDALDVTVGRVPLSDLIGLDASRVFPAVRRELRAAVREGRRTA